MRPNDQSVECNLDNSNFREFNDRNLKKSTRKRKAESTPEFKRKLRKFERESEVKKETRMSIETLNNKVNEECLSETERLLPMMKGNKKEMVDQLKEFITETQIEASKKFETAVKGLKDLLTKQNNELIDVRNDVTSMKKRLENLERKEATSDNAIDVKIREREKNQEKRKKVKAEIEEEEKRLWLSVSQFPIKVKKRYSLN